MLMFAIFWAIMQVFMKSADDIIIIYKLSLLNEPFKTNFALFDFEKIRFLIDLVVY